MYLLDTPIDVGGGVGQLGAESAADLERSARQAASTAATSMDEMQPEPDRWQGAVGGGIEFRRPAAAAQPAAQHAQQEESGGPAPAAPRLTLGDEEDPADGGPDQDAVAPAASQVRRSSGSKNYRRKASDPEDAS